MDNSNVFQRNCFSETDMRNIKEFCIRHRTMAFLKIAVISEDPEIIVLYNKHVDAHNKSIFQSQFPNSGFDLFITNDEIFDMPNAVKMVNLCVKTEMTTYTHYDTNDFETPTAYYVFPRSSMSKTELILANHTGIIDSGYRGNLMAAFKWLKPTMNPVETYVISKNTRLLQICHPVLCPIIVQIVPESELTTTERGDGGFGSTGK